MYSAVSFIEELLKGRTVSELLARADYSPEIDLYEEHTADIKYNRFSEEQWVKIVTVLAEQNVEWGYHLYRFLQDHDVNILMCFPRCDKCREPLGVPCENRERYKGVDEWGFIYRKNLGPCPGRVCSNCAAFCYKCNARLCPNCVFSRVDPTCEKCYDGNSHYTEISTGTCEMCRHHAQIYSRPKSPLSSRSPVSWGSVEEGEDRLTKLYEVTPGTRLALDPQQEACFLNLMSKGFSTRLPQELWRKIFLAQL